jgi:hypothetical protein
MFIELRQGNQGYNFLDSKYKIIWSYNNTTKFFFTDLPVIWARNKILGIGSDNKDEIIYLFALLNSSITRLLLDSIVKIEQEDTRTILVSLQIIKDQIRIPKLTEENQTIKSEIIRRVEELITLEKQTLSDLVDFSGVMVQKFDSLSVDNNYLILIKDNENKRCKIKDNPELVKKVLEQELSGGKLFDKNVITLSELKSLSIIDIERQKKLKNYIDDLVFALYFNIELEGVNINKASAIKSVCSKNKFYGLLQE